MVAAEANGSWQPDPVTIREAKLNNGLVVTCVHVCVGVCEMMRRPRRLLPPPSPPPPPAFSYLGPSVSIRQRGGHFPPCRDLSSLGQRQPHVYFITRHYLFRSAGGARRGGGRGGWGAGEEAKGRSHFTLREKRRATISFLLSLPAFR